MPVSGLLLFYSSETGHYFLITFHNYNLNYNPNYNPKHYSQVSAHILTKSPSFNGGTVAR